MFVGPGQAVPSHIDPTTGASVANDPKTEKEHNRMIREHNFKPTHEAGSKIQSYKNHPSNHPSPSSHATGGGEPQGHQSKPNSMSASGSTGHITGSEPPKVAEKDHAQERTNLGIIGSVGGEILEEYPFYEELVSIAKYQTSALTPVGVELPLVVKSLSKLPSRFAPPYTPLWSAPVAEMG
jgi:hypothetical protein